MFRHHPLEGAGINMQMANLPIEYHLHRLILSSPSDMDCPKLLNAASKPSAPQCHISPKKQLHLFIEGFCSGDNGCFSSRPAFLGGVIGAPPKKAHLITFKKKGRQSQTKSIWWLWKLHRNIYAYHFPIWSVRKKTILVKLDHLAVQRMELENDDFRVRSHPPAWRIFPISKWLATPIYKPWEDHLEGGQPDPYPFPQVGYGLVPYKVGPSLLVTISYKWSDFTPIK